MKRKSKYRRFLVGLLIVNIIAILYLYNRTIQEEIPNDIKLFVGREESFDFSVPIMAGIITKDVDVFSVNDQSLNKNSIQVDFSRPFTMRSNQIGQYRVELNLFGILKLKEIKIDVIKPVKVTASGEPIGIYVKTDGVMVLGTSILTCIDGMNYEPALNKLKSGDYIVAINDKKVETKRELIDAIQESDGKNVKLSIRRQEEKMDVSITPVETAVGEYKIGTWIRDDTQGIGTMTFVTQNGQFGALGHGITDIDTSLLMEVSGGDVYTADIVSIVKGKNGCPGELIGLINQNEKNRVGKIKKNTNQGIYGETNRNYKKSDPSDMLEIGLKQDVCLGNAVIRCNVDGSIKDYSIEIQKIDRSDNQLSKGLVIKITDQRLLSLTGGIVQGMSGSPIIQNGKIIGAVTHVFVQDSTKGYGTFIENMVRNLK